MSQSQDPVDKRSSGRRSLHRVPLTDDDLRRQTAERRGTGGTSDDNRDCGFLPAFRDSLTGKIYPSRYADGRPACVHLLEGLPGDLVVERGTDGQPVAVKGSLEPGFTREGRFYTREEAAALAAETGARGERATG
ncbi:MAG: hypothetical protein P8009_09360 [Gammaproteobacteria bacterium]